MSNRFPSRREHTRQFEGIARRHGVSVDTIREWAEGDDE